MSILRSVKIATLLIALGATGTGAGLIAQGPGEAAKKPEAKAQAEAKPQPQPPVDETVFTVQPGKLALTETARGNLEASRSASLISEVEVATTLITLKPEGSNVSKGEVVAELDSALLRDTLVNQQITVQQAEAAYKTARLVREVAEYAVREYLEGVLPQDLATYKARIASAEKGLKEGEARLERSRTTRKKLDDMFGAKGPETPSDIVADLTLNALIETTEQGLANDKRELETARKNQEILEKFTREKMTRKIQADVEQARGDEINKETRWNLEKTKAKKLESQIEKCTLKAPSDGILVYAPRRIVGDRVVVIEEGATVRQRQMICQIFDLKEPLRVNAKVSEALVDQVKVGNKVTVKIDAFPNQTYTGTVLSVAPMCDPTTVPQQQLKVYTTYIGLDKTEPAMNLRPGMSASSTILIRELDHVLTVPAGVLIETRLVDGTTRYQTDVKTTDGTIERRNVVVGMWGGNLINGSWEPPVMVEIKEGLKAGDILPFSRGGGFQ
jgi:HlyD family secretion protein